MKEKRISPSKVRADLDGVCAADLVESVRQFGVIQPIGVHRGQLVFGRRRLAAAREARKKTVAAVELTAAELALVPVLEALQRREVDPIERANLLKDALRQTKQTQASLAKLLGWQQGRVAQLLGLLRLPDEWQRLLITGVITERHARYLVRHADNPEVWGNALIRFRERGSCSAEEFGQLVAKVISDLERPEEPELDAPPTPENTLERYAQRTVKRITLLFPKQEYDAVIERLDSIKEWEDCDSYTEVFLCCLEAYEQAQRNLG